MRHQGGEGSVATSARRTEEAPTGSSHLSDSVVALCVMMPTLSYGTRGRMRETVSASSNTLGMPDVRSTMLRDICRVYRWMKPRIDDGAALGLYQYKYLHRKVCAQES
jgi:hypothetical protein